MIHLRKATMEDLWNLFRWKNDVVTRRNALLTESVIELREHTSWLEKTLSNSQVELFIIHRDQPVGDIRFDIKDDIEVSIRLDPQYRGQGIGTEAIKLGCRMIQPKYKQDLIARIVEGNIASMNVFVRNGFKFVDYEGGEKRFYTLRRSYEIYLGKF